MRNNLTTIEVMGYFNKTKQEVAKWRDDGLKCIDLGSGYIYSYSDIMNYLEDV